MAYLDWVGDVLTRIQATVVSAGPASAGALVGLNAGGKLDVSVLPTGVGADTQAIVASEALSAGDLVNVYNNAGTANCRKADNSNGREAWGYVTAAVASGGTATVFFEATNSAINGTNTTLGPTFLGTAGGVVSTAPLTPGTIIQRVGVVGAGGLNFQSGEKTVNL